MATQPKPKPKPEPEPKPKPKPDDDDDAEGGLHGDPTDGNPGGTAPEPTLTERIDAIFESQAALIERVTKLEERVAAPPIPVGRHVAGSS